MVFRLLALLVVLLKSGVFVVAIYLWRHLRG